MEIEIFEEDGDNSVSFETEYSSHNIDFYPDTKTYKARMNLKEDVYYRTEKFEYRITKDPIKVESRLIERVDEPPQRYSVKDGVVLESEIRADQKFHAEEFINDRKEEVKWHDEWAGGPVSMYILSKHPDVIPSEEYRRYLRQLSENIKTSLLKVDKAIESDKLGLVVTDEYSGSGRKIWFTREVQDKMSKEEIEKAIEHAEKVKKGLFDKDSKDYVGITVGEFGVSSDTLKHIDLFLNKKDKPVVGASKGSPLGKFFAFVFHWIWLLILVSIALWLVSLVIPAIQYSFIFAFIISGILTTFFSLRKKRIV
jgi:hypothetical protein